MPVLIALFKVDPHKNNHDLGVALGRIARRVDNGSCWLTDLATEEARSQIEPLIHPGNSAVFATVASEADIKVYRAPIQG